MVMVEGVWRGIVRHAPLLSSTCRAYAMGMPLPHTEWTAEMAIALPWDGRRYEVLDGELVVTPSPAWSHQTAVEELFVLLRAYVQQQALGWAKLSPADIVFSARRLVQPDVFVVPRGEGTVPRAWSEVHELLLAVEVLSPSTARVDRGVKRRIYQSERVPEYWIVDPGARVVERWRPQDTQPEMCRDTLTWAPRADVAPLAIDLVSLFAVVAGEVP
jgi:Uma2 family endonuclease